MDPEESSSRVSRPCSDESLDKDLVLTDDHIGISFVTVIARFFALQFSQAEVGYRREAGLVRRYGVGDVQQAREHCPLPSACHPCAGMPDLTSPGTFRSGGRGEASNILILLVCQGSSAVIPQRTLV